MSGQHDTAARGVGASLLASLLFAAVFYLSGVIDAPAQVVFAWRVLLTLACYAAMLCRPQARRALREYWLRLTSAWWTGLLFPALCTLVGVQLWLFSWAPMHGHALGVSLGFLLLPIALVLGGRFVLGEPVTRGQWTAVTLAGVAVACKIAFTPQVSWTTFVVCLGYPLYFIVRRRVGLDSPAAFGVEMAAISPLAIVLVATTHSQTVTTAEYGALTAVGLSGAAAMAAYLAASRLLTLPVFGLLGYAEPVLLVAVAVVLGETIHAADHAVYGLLLVALIVLATDGYRASPPSGRGSAGTDEWLPNARA